MSSKRRAYGNNHSPELTFRKMTVMPDGQRVVREVQKQDLLKKRRSGKLRPPKEKPDEG